MGGGASTANPPRSRALKNLSEVVCPELRLLKTEMGDQESPPLRLTSRGYNRVHEGIQFPPLIYSNTGPGARRGALRSSAEAAGGSRAAAGALGAVTESGLGVRRQWRGGKKTTKIAIAPRKIAPNAARKKPSCE